MPHRVDRKHPPSFAFLLCGNADLPEKATLMRETLLLSWAELARTPEEARQILLDCASDIVQLFADRQQVPVRSGVAIRAQKGIQLQASPVKLKPRGFICNRFSFEGTPWNRELLRNAASMEGSCRQLRHSIVPGEKSPLS